MPTEFLREDAAERLKRAAEDIKTSFKWKGAQHGDSSSYQIVCDWLSALSKEAAEQGKTKAISIEADIAQDPIAVMEARMKAFKAETAVPQAVKPQ